MTRLLRAVALSLLLGAGLAAAANGFEQVVVANTAIGLTAARFAPVSGVQSQTATCRLELAEVRFTLDGTVPTTTVGTLLEVGDWLTITGIDNMRSFSAIRTTAVSGQLDCNYFR